MERKSYLSLRNQKHLCFEESSSVSLELLSLFFGLRMTNELRCAKLKETFDGL
jgi:hypothetical protein